MREQTMRSEEPYEQELQEMGLVSITINDITYDVLELIHKEKEAV